MTMTADPPARASRGRSAEPTVAVVKRYAIHELCLINPPMTAAEFEALKTSIATSPGGQEDPADLFEGKILDGRHRQEACIDQGIILKTQPFTGTYEEAYHLVCARAARRSVSDSQRACQAVEALPFHEKLAESRKKKGHSAEMRYGPAGKSAEHVAKLFSVGSRSVELAKWLKENAPKRFAKVWAGGSRLNQEVRRCKNDHKADRIAQKAKLSKGKLDAKIHTGDALLWMPLQSPAHCSMIFADPRYNIGIDYGEGPEADLLSDRQYLGWCARWMREARRLLRPNGSIWVVINDQYAAQFCRLLQKVGFHLRSWVKWYETFGNNNSDNFNSTSRHLFYCTYHSTNFIFDTNVRYPSSRQLDYDDARADPDGKILDNVWIIPRVVDNAEERVPGFPTQLPLEVVTRAIRYCTEPGDLIYDPFTGSGTTAEAALKLGRRFVGTEINPDFVALANMRLKARCG